MKILSFIVPSYNSQQYLEKVIGSFTASTVLDALDIIIVNDGSTDGTHDLAEQLSGRYPHSVRLIDQPNKGHGGALNTGCAAAVGKYLKVIDADDWVETENLPEFVEFLRECESDVVLTHHYTRDISTGEVKKWKSYPEAFGRAYTFDEIMPRWKSFDRSLTFHGITYKTAFYQEKGMALSEHVFYEDHEYATVPCCYAASVTPLDCFIYDYRVGDVQQSVSDANQLRRLGHVETVLQRLMTEYPELALAEDAGGRSYYRMKVQGLLLSYLTTALLVDPDRKHGRQLAAAMMDRIGSQMPQVRPLAEKQYRIFTWMNRLGIRKKTWEAISGSRLYNRLRHNHDFS